MSPNQALINGLLTRELSKKQFLEIKDKIKINDQFLSRILAIQRKRIDMDKHILDFLSDSIVTYIKTGEDTVAWLERELEDVDINSFHKLVLRKLDASINPKPKALDKLLGYYAM